MNKILFISILLCGWIAPAFSQNYITTEHGYRFINHTAKKGDKPTPGSTVNVHIAAFVGAQLMQETRGMAPAGYSLPMPTDAQMKASPKVPAIFDAVLLMAAGDSATIFMELDSMLKSTLPPALKSEKEVRYEVVLNSFVSAEAAAKEKEAMLARESTVAASMKEMADKYAKGTLAGLETLPSGLKMLVTDPGTGAPIVKGEQVKTHYYGALTNGTEFDNSFKRGEPLPFAAGIGQMIPGFDEGVMQLRHGAKAYLFIPSKLGYGENGTGGIPANSELIFYIEIQ